jgi:hypothetical protein
MSNTEVGKFLLVVGQELGRTPQQMESLIKKIVEDQWYDSLDSLKALTDEQWEKLGLPGRLIEKLKERLSDGMPQLEAISPPQGGLEIAPNSVSETPSVPVFLVIRAIHEELSGAPEQMVETTRTLTRIVSNILSEPSNAKFRILKTDSAVFQSKISKSQGAIQLLGWLGFELGGGLYSCNNVYIGRFTDAQTELVKLLSIIDPEYKAPPASEAFNPFKASFTNAGDTFGVPKGKLLEDREAELTQLRKETEEIKRRVPEKQGVPLEPPKLVSVGNGSASSSKKYDEGGEDDSSLLLNSLRSIAAAGESAQKFRSREKVELERIRNRTVFPTTKVRIAFADKKALELVISSGETVMSLHDMVSKYLRSQVKGWALVITPPPRKLEKSSSKNMLDEDFAPSVTLRMTVNGSPCNSFDVLVPELIV